MGLVVMESILMLAVSLLLMGCVEIHPLLFFAGLALFVSAFIRIPYYQDKIE